jgi:hypothetical protein
MTLTIMKYFIFWFLFVITFMSCDNRSSDNTSSDLINNKSALYPQKEIVDDNFNDFIDRFSADSVFQLNRTKSPLKIKRYYIDTDQDTVHFLERANFEMIDFRKTKSEGKYDQWEQKIVVDKNGTTARIEIRGIENGIMVDYLFEKKTGIWMLIEIDDSST